MALKTTIQELYLTCYAKYPTYYIQIPVKRKCSSLLCPSTTQYRHPKTPRNKGTQLSLAIFPVALPSLTANTVRSTDQGRSTMLHVLICMRVYFTMAARTAPKVSQRNATGHSNEVHVNRFNNNLDISTQTTLKKYSPNSQIKHMYKCLKYPPPLLPSPPPPHTHTYEHRGEVPWERIALCVDTNTGPTSFSCATILAIITP